MARKTAFIVAAATIGVTSWAFTARPMSRSFPRSSVLAPHMTVPFVPDGFTPEQWKKEHNRENSEEMSDSEVGYIGPRGINPRPLQHLQEDRATITVPYVPEGFTAQRWKAEHESSYHPTPQSSEDTYVGPRGANSDAIHHLTEDHASYTVPYVPDGFTAEQWREVHERELQNIHKSVDIDSENTGARPPVQHMQEDVDLTTVMFSKVRAENRNGQAQPAASLTTEQVDCDDHDVQNNSKASRESKEKSSKSGYRWNHREFLEYSDH